VSDVRRCGRCGARLGARDRVCFSCHRPLSEPLPLSEPGPPARAGALRAALPGADESYLIGSDPRCKVRLEHPLIQPRHVAVRRDGGGVLCLEDQGTAAGTYLNGQRVRGAVRAGLGDVRLRRQGLGWSVGRG
jgi:hypothetical protein